MKKFGEQDFAQWYFSERNLQILYKNGGDLCNIFCQNKKKINGFLTLDFYDHIIQKK